MTCDMNRELLVQASVCGHVLRPPLLAAFLSTLRRMQQRRQLLLTALHDHQYRISTFLSLRRR